MTTFEINAMVRKALELNDIDYESIVVMPTSDVGHYTVTVTLASGEKTTGTARGSGWFSIQHGSFGRLTHDGLDVFEGL